jgi:hypothetical protein
MPSPPHQAVVSCDRQTGPPGRLDCRLHRPRVGHRLLRGASQPDSANMTSKHPARTFGVAPTVAQSRKHMKQPHSGLHPVGCAKETPPRSGAEGTQYRLAQATLLEGGRCKARPILEDLLFNIGHARWRLRCSSTVPRLPHRPMYVPFDAATAAWAAIMMSSAGPRRLVELGLVDLPDAPRAREPPSELTGAVTVAAAT